ncbi:MAG: hypothetical protein HY706_09650 [Candidatus Hydrogenedentes bacterium]|nr:hypothetical protein [Candidatus Hydrogenedentota bacterium]
MDARTSLMSMLKQLQADMLAIQQQGAGYYSCVSVAKRYNKLLAQARTLFPAGNGLIDTFEAIAEADPKDPGEKMKVIQGIRIEIGQLMSLLASVPEAPK